VHVAFRVGGKADVDAFYRAALDAGAADNGAPGPRPEYTANYYACFVLDPDGYNIEAMINEPAAAEL
jgi:catechol 2,3-dioxygenase-like lactoylglutathione lyase family enzyme